RQTDADQRRLQVAFDVVGQGLQRRHVQHPTATLRIGRDRLGGQPIQTPQKGRQRLSRTSRCQDQGVLAASNRGPALFLGRRRRRERGFKPVVGGGTESIQRSRHKGYLTLEHPFHFDLSSSALARSD